MAAGWTGAAGAGRDAKADDGTVARPGSGVIEGWTAAPAAGAPAVGGETTCTGGVCAPSAPLATGPGCETDGFAGRGPAGTVMSAGFVTMRIGALDPDETGAGIGVTFVGRTDGRNASPALGFAPAGVLAGAGLAGPGTFDGGGTARRTGRSVALGTGTGRIAAGLVDVPSRSACGCRAPCGAVGVARGQEG